MIFGWESRTFLSVHTLRSDVVHLLVMLAYKYYFFRLLYNSVENIPAKISEEICKIFLTIYGMFCPGVTYELTYKQVSRNTPAQIIISKMYMVLLFMP